MMVPMARREYFTSFSKYAVRRSYSIFAADSAGDCGRGCVGVLIFGILVVFLGCWKSGGWPRLNSENRFFGWRTLWHLVFQRVRSLTLKRRAGGRALIPKNAFGCRIPAVFRVRSLTLKRRRGGRGAGMGEEEVARIARREKLRFMEPVLRTERGSPAR